VGEEKQRKCQTCGREWETGEGPVEGAEECPRCGAPISVTPGETEQAQDGEDMGTAGKPETWEGGVLRVRSHNLIAIVEFTTSRLMQPSKVQQLAADLTELLDKHRFNKIILDFGNVNYLNSNVMGKLVHFQKKVSKKGAQLRLCNIAPHVFEIFDIMQFSKIFKICESEAAAVRDLAD